MRFRQPSLRSKLAWLVSCTILLAALLPMLSHVVLARDSAAWAEICTATGAKFVRLDMGPESGDPQKGSGQMTMECAYCAIHHGPSPLPPPAEAGWQPPSALRFERPQLFLHAPRPLFAWAPVLARGPPARA